MDPERLLQIEKLYHAAREYAPAERAAFLVEACTADDGLRHEVEMLLRDDSAEWSFIEGKGLELVAQRLGAAALSEAKLPFLAGQQIGAYKILGPLGKGGMGEVYRAKDERLNRAVAIKVLPSSFVQDATLLKRFEQEARATSALNHPNILTIYDIGEHAGTPYIVAELLEGEELRAQMPSGSEAGALPVRKAIEYAQQIAAGLAAAHDKGIVHRDLKPENLFVTKDGRVKILDFGLAKLKPQRLAGGVDSEAPTQKPLTNPGMVMGTVGYMSPEQVRGQEVDHRSDIFSFGMILYEMLSGKRPFSGASMADVMSAILKDEPPELSETNAKINPALDKLVRHCLEKQPELRFQSARDLGFALEAVAAHASWPSGAQLSEVTGVVTDQTGSKWRIGLGQFGWLAAAIFLVVFVGSGIAYFKRAQPEALALRFMQFAPEKTNFAAFSVSPDGQRLAFSAADLSGKRLLYVRPLNSFTAQALPGTEDAALPFWSPDSRSLGFFSEGKLKRIELLGATPQTICEAKIPVGASWNRAGEIVLSGSGDVLYRVPATGGVPTALTTLDASHGEIIQGLPQFLPDGQHFLYFANYNYNQAARTGIYVGSLSDKATKLVLNTECTGSYAAGHLLFAKGGTLLGQVFDPGALKLVGAPFQVAEQVRTTPFLPVFFTHFSVSESGVLAYQTGASKLPQLIWYDQTGKQLGAVGEPANYSNPSLSADDKRLAVGIRDPNTKKRDIWLFDLARGAKSRFTFDPADDLNPLWSRDGSRVFFTSDRKGQRDIFQKKVDAAEEEELVYTSPEIKNVSDLSPDGRLMIYVTNPLGFSSSTQNDLWLLSLEEERTAKPFLKTQFQEEQPTISPDGRYVAYASYESGRGEVYVTTFPQLGGKWQVSVNGGVEPQWRRDGKELFFVVGDKILMAVEVKATAAGFETGVPRQLFETPFVNPGRNNYVVTSDGKRFLVITRVEDTASPPINVVVNWMAEVKK
ncbi:MAG: serine/threonine-protein kinase [Acidobacteria bacterium]|nr:serine/threonine-protein kinase [Acidobacteriota bacterium]